MPTASPSAAAVSGPPVAARGDVTLAELTAFPALVRQLQAPVEELEAKVAARSEAEALLDVHGAAEMLHMTPGAV